MSEIVPGGRTAAELAALVAARDYAVQGQSPHTIRNYRIGWRHFAAYCAQMGWSACPADPKHVAAYIAGLAGRLKVGTIRLRLAAIADMHRKAGHEFNETHAAIRETRRGIERAHGEPPKQARAITLGDIAAMVGTCDDSPIGVRDRAMILLGFAGGFRRSELVALEIPDIEWRGAGLRCIVRRSKGDQGGRGEFVDIPYGKSIDTCPVRAVRRWLDMLRLSAGPLFRRLSVAGNLHGSRAMTGGTVGDRLAARAEMAGIDPVTAHGLRAGFVTTALGNGARGEDVMLHVRHKNISTTLRYYRRSGEIAESPAGKLGL